MENLAGRARAAKLATPERETLFDDIVCMLGVAKRTKPVSGLSVGTIGLALQKNKSNSLVARVCAHCVVLCNCGRPSTSDSSNLASSVTLAAF